jgi:hypothetical protein
LANGRKMFMTAGGSGWGKIHDSLFDNMITFAFKILGSLFIVLLQEVSFQTRNFKSENEEIL